MVTNRQLRDALRPQGQVTPSCQGCQWRQDCGGFHSGRLFGNCFEETCCEFTGKNKSACNAICPYKDDFDDWLKDTNGLGFDDLAPISQPVLILPHYIPVVDHRSARSEPLDHPFVALKTYRVMRLGRGADPQYRAIAKTPEELRDAFLLGKRTNIVLRGVDKDPPLERYWENRRKFDAPEQLAQLGIHAAIGPNFSHFLNVPYTDHLFNKKRQLLCLGELNAAGIAAAPHLNAVKPGDWWFWRSFLQKNSEVRYVAIEFQTGNKNPKQGRQAIDYLVAVQREIERPLHLIVVGGAQFVEYAAARFADISLIDMKPFYMAMHRYQFDLAKGKQPWRTVTTAKGQPLDQLLAANISGYSEWIQSRIQVAQTAQPTA